MRAVYAVSKGTYSDRLAEHKAHPFKYRKQINP